MNRPCEGSAKSGAAFFYAQILFHFCAHKPYAPEHPAEPPPRPVCTRSPLCVGCPYPANGFFCWGKDGKCLLLLGKGREVPALGDAAAQCPGQAGDTRSERGVISR